MSLIKDFHHVSVIVANLETSLRFYRDLLELTVDSSRPDLSYPGSWLTLGNYQIHLMELDNPYSDSQLPLHGGRDRHFAMSTSNIDLIIQKLEENKISFTVSKSGRKALFCRDPDNNVLEFVEQTS